MLAGIDRVVLGFAVRLDPLLDLRLILNELDIGYLRFGQRRDDEEEGQDEHGQHEREVEYIRPAGRFRQFDDHIRIDAAPAHGGVIVGVTHGISDEADEKEDENKRDCRAHVPIGEDHNQHAIGLDVKGDAKIPERFENLLGKAHSQEDDHVQPGHGQKEHALTTLAVV